MIYFGTRLSDNLSRREPEGYLLCLNVPVARTGTQEYLPEELGLPPGGPPVPVFRPEEEVFSAACMASFEGMPVTDGHPAFPEGVTAENIRWLQKGHAHNIRRGSGPESDLLLADLIITDPGLAGEILGGKREISCGYNYTLCEEDGRYVQRSIRGNHIAVVDAGRAGPRVSIRDQHPSIQTKSLSPDSQVKYLPPDRQASVREFARETLEQRRFLAIHDRKGSVSLEPLRCERRREPSREGEFPEQRAVILMKKHDERSTHPMKKSEKNGNLYAKHTARLMARMARDGETEELAEMIAELVDPENPDPAAEAAEEIPAETEAPDPVPVPEIREAEAEPCEHSIQEDCGERIVSLLQQIFSFLQSAADCGSPCGNPSRDEETPAESAEGREDPVETLVEEVIRETVQPDPAAFVNEALEAVLSDPGTGEEDSLSSVLSPEEEPAADRAADALRAAMSAFRPVLKTMAPDARRRVVQRIASDLRTRNRRRSGAASDTLAILKGSAGRVPSAGTDLGKRIMEKRNANLHRQA